MRIRYAFILGVVLTLSTSVRAQAPGAQPAAGPMSEKEVLNALKKEGATQVVTHVQGRGVDFELTPDIEKHLRKAKATDDVVKAVTAGGPKERAEAKAAAMGGGGLSLAPDEKNDFLALQSELDPDKALALSQDYVKKHPQSQVLTYIYAFEANAYAQKGDAAKTVEYAEKSLELKKDNLMSLLVAAAMIPTPQYITHQANEEQQLNHAESYAQAALAALDTLKKSDTEDQARFEARKNGYVSSVHADMGMIHLDRAQLGLMGLDKEELAKAEKEYQQAISMTDSPDPVAYYRLGDSCRLAGKYQDAVAAYTKAGELGQGAIKQYADQQVTALKAAIEKQKSAAPAKQ